MKLAVSQIAFAPGGQQEGFALLQKHGYAGLEIAPTMAVGPDPYSSPAKAAEFAAQLRQEYNLAVCSMQSLWYGIEGCMFGPEQDFLLEYTRKAILFAQAAGAQNLVFGCPRNRNLPSGVPPEAAVPFFTQLGAFAAACGCALAIEANPPIYGTNFLNTTQQALDMVQAVGSPGIKLNLDFGTMVHNAEPVAMLAGRVGDIQHVHISEPGLVPVQKRQAHQELAALLRQEGYAGYISIEMKQLPLEEIEQIMLYVAEVFG